MITVGGADVAQRTEPSPLERVKQWVRVTVRQSGMSKTIISERLGYSKSWLTMITHPENKTCPKLAQLEALAHIAREALPADVIADVQLCRSKSSISGPGVLAVHPKRAIDLSPLQGCATVADEIRELIRRATLRFDEGVRDRNRIVIERRFGIGLTAPTTLEEIGRSEGLTRERIRQIESKVAERFEEYSNGMATPHLDAVQTQLKVRAGTPLQILQQDLASLLGQIPIKGVIEFLAHWSLQSRQLSLSTIAVLSGGERVVVAGGEDDARLVREISIVLNRQQSYAGASSIDAIRRELEESKGEVVSLKWLEGVVEQISGLEWLDVLRHWCWIKSENITPLIERTAVIIALAERPVSIESIYGGLAREARRPQYSRAAESVEGLPPFDVVARVISSHPLFRRCSASRFDLAQPFNVDDYLHGHRKALRDELERHGGAASWAALSQPIEEGNNFSRPAWRMSLYLCGWIERVAPATYAIRGRRLDSSVVRAIEERDVEENGGRRAAHEGPWEVTVALTENAKRNLLVTLPKAKTPLSVAGEYTLPCGHVALVDDAHSVRLTRLSPALKSAVRGKGRGLRFEFDSERRTARFEPLMQVK